MFLLHSLFSIFFLPFFLLQHVLVNIREQERLRRGSKCEHRSHLLLEEVNYTDADAPAGSGAADADGTLDLSCFCMA